jgi:mannose-1-phosphate guanylyltransferase
MVFNGDVLSGADLTRCWPPTTTPGRGTLHLVRVSDPRAFGCVPTDDDGRVLAFLEKTEDPPTDQINAGTYVFNRADHRPDPARPRGVVEREVFPACCPTA